VDSAGPTYELPAESLKRGGSLVERGRVAVRLEDVLAVRSLVERVGAEHLRTLIAAFERRGQLERLVAGDVEPGIQFLRPPKERFPQERGDPAAGGAPGPAEEAHRAQRGRRVDGPAAPGVPGERELEMLEEAAAELLVAAVAPGRLILPR